MQGGEFHPFGPLLHCHNNFVAIITQRLGSSLFPSRWGLGTRLVGSGIRGFASAKTCTVAPWVARTMFWEYRSSTLMMASVGVQAKSCSWPLLLCCFFFTQGGAQNANCSNASEQPLLEGIDPPAGNSTIIYRIFGELLDQVVNVDITVDGAPNMRTIIQRNSSEILFRFGVIAARLPTTANVSLRPNNSACETFSRTVSLHRFRKFVHVWGAPSSVKPNLVLVA